MNNKVRSMEKARQRKVDAESTLSATIADLINSSQAISNVLGCRPERPGRTMMLFCDLIPDIQKKLNGYNEQRKALCELYGTLREDGSSYDFAKDSDNPTEEEQLNIKKFKEAHQELLETSITLSGKKMPELLDIVPLTGAEIIALRWLLK